MMTRATWKTGASVVALACGLGLVIGEEPVSVHKPEDGVVLPMPLREAKLAKDLWLGIQVLKPSPAVQAQLKEIPRGVGFMIDRVVEDSPAQSVGLREYDFVWKMDDQLLINSHQFMTLLNLKSEGDPVTLTIQRRGENQEIELTVEQRPDDQRGRERADAKVMAPFIPGIAGVTYDHLGREAVISDGTGTVQIRRKGVGDGYNWAELDEFDLELGKGELTGADEEAFPPGMDETLKKKLQALIRGYEQSERNGRAPRVRRAPTGDVSRVRRAPESE